MFEIILFISIGFIGLFYGGKYVIIGLENIAYRRGISHLMVGLTILAIGTSLPEISVSVLGGIDKILGIDQYIDGIVIGNKVGSFFVQITLILGILGLYQHISVSKWILRREGSMLFISVFIFLFVSIDGVITQLEALSLIIFYFLYLILIIKSEKKIEHGNFEKVFIEEKGLKKTDFTPVEQIKKTTSLKKDIGIFSLGLIILLISAEITVIASISLAKEFNLPGNVIGILIVGIGTSIPELSVDLIALRRKSGGIAVGDILGSNICDILLATGSGAIISSFNVPLVLLLFDIPMLIIAIAMVYYFFWTEKTLKKWESMLLLFYFGIYVSLKLIFFQQI